MSVSLQSDKVADIEAYYLRRKNLKTDETIDKIQLGTINREFFKDYILKKQLFEEKIRLYEADKRVNDSSKLIFDCYKKYYSSLESWCNKLDNKKKIDFLIDILTVLLEKFELLTISVTNDVEAFTIFETLNDRGLDLTIADLFEKLYLFSVRKQNEFK